MRKTQNPGASVTAPFRPFWSIWRDTESTVLHLVHENPGYRLLVWPILGSLGFSSLYEVTGLSASNSTEINGLFWGSLFSFGPLVEIALLFTYGWLLSVVGGRLGGVGSPTALQAAIAWANVPVVCFVAVQLIVALPVALLSDYDDGGFAGRLWFATNGVLACFELAAVAASVILLVRGVSAVHGLPLRKASTLVMLCWAGGLLLCAAITAMVASTEYVSLVLFGPLFG